MDETAIDHALLDALRKADPGPYPKRVPYAATIRQFLPDPVTAFRWATCTAAGTIVLGTAALVVKAMGIGYEAPPLASPRALADVPLDVQREIPADVPPDVQPEIGAVGQAPTAVPARATSARTLGAPSNPADGEPVTLVAEDAGKVSVVPAGYEPRHATPDLDLKVLGVRVAVDLS